ncbi:MAG TPA: serine/threonine-protein kinase [Polyangiaceae bacterium]|jgi:serine/threonine-protein kinase|nr:serine/threonine-protein kinase [Polyangiaceae bacterium]
MSERYQIVERIAAGGMAEVYRGESAGVEGFRKRVAIKRVLPQLSANRDFIGMFLDEARLGAYLSHSRCVQVFDIGQAGGAHFIVMEYVDGADLQTVLAFLTSRQQRMSVEVACMIVLGVCEGLSYAHQATDHQGRPLEIVHRDISPHNVLLTKYGEVKLVDFGLAKASSHLVAEDHDIVKGKFGYLSPEVTLGQGSDHRVDIFAAGILLWEMLAGRRLFRGETDVDTFHLVRATVVPDVRELRDDVPDALFKVITRALARDPKDRYQTADDFAKELSLVLMHADRPATYVDIGRLVRPAAAVRAQKRAADGRDTPGVLGDLILDALHDFSGPSSAAPESLSAQLGTGGVTAAGEFVDPAAWGLEALFDEPRESAPSRQRPPAPSPSRAPVTAAVAAPLPAPTTSAAPNASSASKKEAPFWRKWFSG